MRAAAGSHDGFTLTELLVAVALTIIATAAAVPMVTTSLDASKTRGAARYLSGRMNLARSEAIKRWRFVALRVEPEGTFYRFTFYEDGNGNGIRTADIRAGVDRPFGPTDRLHEKFGGVTFGILPGVTAIDPGETLAAGSDPIRFGASDLVSFNPNGSTSAGTFYIVGRHAQAAVRLLGVTGRLRVLWFDFATMKWISR